MALQIAYVLNNYFLNSRFLLKTIPFLEVYPSAQRHPYLIFLFRASLLQLSLNVKQYLVTSSYRIIKVRKGTCSIGFLLSDRLEGFFALHWFFYTAKIFLVLNVSLLDILKLLLTRIVALESCRLEEILVALWFFEDV